MTEIDQIDQIRTKPFSAILRPIENSTLYFGTTLRYLHRTITRIGMIPNELPSTRVMDCSVGFYRKAQNSSRSRASSS